MRIFTCNSCTKIHIETGNILLHFASTEKLTQYLHELDNIDAEYYAVLNSGKAFSKDIFLQVPNTNLNLGFTIEEFTVFRESIREYLHAKPQQSIFINTGHQDICMN